jgi:hypothetical protein
LLDLFVQRRKVCEGSTKDLTSGCLRERFKVQGTGYKVKTKKNLSSSYALRLMTQSAKRRAQSEKLSMSKLPTFVRYAPCAMLYAN